MRYDESDVMFLSRKISAAVEDCARGIVTGASKYIGSHRWGDRNVSATFPVTTESGVEIVVLVSLFDDQTVAVDFFTTDKNGLSEFDRLAVGGNNVGHSVYGVEVENTLDFSASAKAIVDLTDEISEDICDICESIDDSESEGHAEADEDELYDDEDADEDDDDDEDSDEDSDEDEVDEDDYGDDGDEDDYGDEDEDDDEDDEDGEE